MVEYLRLNRLDWFPRSAADWHRPETLAVVGILVAVCLVVYFVLKK